MRGPFDTRRKGGSGVDGYTNDKTGSTENPFLQESLVGSNA